MIEILGFTFELLFDLVCDFISAFWSDFDLPDTRTTRIVLSIIIAAIGILLWAELR